MRGISALADFFYICGEKQKDNELKFCKFLNLLLVNE